MGKSNRIRVNRANERIKTLGVKNKQKGMPSWAMSLITVVLAAALLLSVSGILLSANGVFNRMTTVVSSANYKVNANMMAYYYNTQYQNFRTNYSSYMSSFSLNPELPLDSQPFGGAEGSTNYDAMLLGEFEGTWHDYFMKTTVDTVKNMLMYCEASAELEVALTDEDYAEINTNLEYYETLAASNGWPSVNSFYSENFGKGISESDVRKCMELSLLASKTMEKLADKIDASVTEPEIEAKYDGNALDYDVIDYTYYIFKVNYDEAAKKALGKDYKEADLEKQENKDKVLAEYKAMIAKAQDAAKELEGKTTLEDFKAYIYNYVATKAVDDNYGSQTIGEEAKGSLTDDQITAIKAELVKNIIAEATKDDAKDVADKAIDIKDDDADDKTYEFAGATVTKAFAKIVNTVNEKAYSTVKSATTTYNVEKAGYTKDNKFSEWAFKEAKLNDKKLIAEYDASKDGAMVTDQGEIKAESKQAQIGVYLITETRRQDTDKAKNFTYMIFSTEATAKEAIAELVAGGTVTKDAFLAMAETKKATTSNSITDYTKGAMGSTEFDEWVFETAKNAGDLTATPIKTTSDSTSVYIVALYEGEGQELWKLDVKSTIVNEKAEAEATRLQGAHAITVYDNRLKRVKVKV